MKNISYSTEVLTSFIQASTFAPDSKFEAVQTPDGHSLLFSISTDHRLFLTEEVIGNKSGWVSNDISAELFAMFTSATNVLVKDFVVGQTHHSETFCVLVALTVDGNDHLFMANSYVRNEASEVSVSWVEIPYDGTENLSVVNISDMFLKDTMSHPLIVIDLEAANGFIQRYYIDALDKVQGVNRKWIAYNIPADINISTDGAPIVVQAGRRYGKYGDGVDGLYTLGYQPSGESVIVYEQLHDEFDISASGDLLILNLSNDPNFSGKAQRIATAETVMADPNPWATFTDLYATTDEGDLFLFRSDKQISARDAEEVNFEQATFIMNNPLFKDMEQLFAFSTPEKAVVLGRNRSGQAFYTQCAIENYELVGAWTYPMSLFAVPDENGEIPAEEQVYQMSPYTNRKNGGNTLFVNIGGNAFQKLFQDPISTLWQVQEVHLPLAADLTPKEYDSFTTKVTITDENNNAIPETYLEVSSGYRVPVYINSHYYVLDVEPIQIKSNGSGSITICQAVTDELQGACLSIQVMEDTNSAEETANTAPNLVKVGDALLINPMDKSNEQLMALDSTSDLEAAEYTDDMGSDPQPLTTSTDPAELDTTIAAINQVSTANDNLTTTDPAANAKLSWRGRLACIAHQPYFKQQEEQPMGTPSYKTEDEGILVAAGDLFRRMRAARQALRREIREKLNEFGETVWEFITEIDGVVMKFVVDTVEKVAGVLQSVLEAVGTVVKGLVQFVKFLFSWDDIKTTADVFSSIIKVTLNDLIYQLDGESMKAAIHTGVVKFQDSINDLLHYSPPAPCPSFNDLSDSSTSSTDSSASDDYLQDNLTDNADSATVDGDMDESTIEAILHDLNAVIQNVEGDVKLAFNEFYSQVIEDGAWRHTSVLEILQTSLGILSNLIIEVAEDILDALIDVLVDLAHGVWDMLNKPVHIPILSHILEKYFNVSLPSMFDVIVLVAAMPATLGYKIINVRDAEPPFQIGDGFTDQILALNTSPSNVQEAEDAMTSLEAIFTGSQPSYKQNGATAKISPESLNEPQSNYFGLSRLFTASLDVVSSLFVISGNTPVVERSKGIQVVSRITGLVRGLVDTTVSKFANPCPIPQSNQTPWLPKLSASMSLISICEKAIFAGLLINSQSTDKAGMKLIMGADSVAKGMIAATNLAIPVGQIMAIMDKYDVTEGTSMVGLTNCGVEFCGSGTTIGGTMLGFMPEETPFAAAFKMASAVVVGSVCLVSGAMRSSELLFLNVSTT